MATKLLPQAQLGVKKTTISASVLRELKPEKKIGIEKGSREESYIQKLETIKEFFLKRYKNDVLTLKEQRKRLLAERRRRQEESIEQNKEAKKKSKSALNPRLRTPSFFKNIFSSIGNFFLYLAGGILFNSFIGLEKSLAGIVKTLEAVGQGIQIFANVIGSVTNFIDSAYKGYDKMVKQISDITGLSQEQINDFSSKFNKLINGTLIASMIILRGLPAFLRNRGGKSPTSSLSTPRIPQTGQFGGGQKTGIDLQKGTRTIKGKTVSAGSASRYTRSVSRFVQGTANIGDVARLARRGFFTPFKKFSSPILQKIPLAGFAIDFLVNHFLFKEPLGKSAFVAAAAGIGTLLGGALGTFIGGPIGTAVGSVVGGTSGDWAGRALYDAIFGDKVSQSTAGLDTQAAYEETTETTNNIIQPIVFA